MPSISLLSGRWLLLLMFVGWLGGPVWGQNNRPSPSGTYLINTQTTSLSVSNACGTGVVSGTATITVTGAVPCTSMQTVKAGSWDDPLVWSCGRVPLLTDVVLIRHAVTVPVSLVAHAQKINFEAGGRLSWGANTRLLLGL